LVFSHLRWDFVFQRPQHLLSRAARTFDVLFFEEAQFAEVDRAFFIKKRSREGVFVVVPVLPVGLSPLRIVAEQRSLLDELMRETRPRHLTCWYYTPIALGFSDHLNPDVCVYDCMDELSAFIGAPRDLRRLEKLLFDRADVVFTGGQSLYETKRSRHGNIHAFPSSIDAAHFATARDWECAEPVDQAAITGPRIGFFAVIDERLDIDLLNSVAAERPDWQFVILGPVVKIDPATLPRRSNLHWLGSKAYDDLPAYLAGWEAGFMPFAINDSTRFISPTKTLEFLAAGVPVVSTAIADVVRPYGEAGLVEIASTPAEAVRGLERALSRPKAAWLQAVDAHLAGTSWDKTWSEMLAHLQRQSDAARTSSPQPSVLSTESFHV
jgi:UDP-galactopyranose mutase